MYIENEMKQGYYSLDNLLMNIVKDCITSGFDLTRVFKKLIEVYPLNSDVEQTLVGIAGKTYIENDYVKNLREASKNYLKNKEQYTHISNATSNVEENIVKYLDSCGEILKNIYLCDVSGKTSIETIPSALKLGTRNDSPYLFTMYSPHVISALYMFAKNLEQYIKCEEFKILSEYEILTNIFAHIFVNNALLRFKRYNIFKEPCKEQYGSSSIVTDLVRTGSETPCESVRLSFVSGIEEIRPILLAEKIIMSFKEWYTQHSNKEVFKVGIIGDIRRDNQRIKERLEELTKTLHNFLKADNELKESQLNINWYLLKMDENENTPTIIDDIVEGMIKITLNNDLHKSNRFFEKINSDTPVGLEEFINNFSLMFFLDCPNLYLTHEFQKIGSTDYYTTYVKDKNFSSNFDDYELDKNLYHSGFIFSLMSNISGHALNNGEHGKMLQRVNTTMLDYMCKYVKSKEQFKRIYVFLSSETAFSNSNYSKSNIVNEERYNEKYVNVINIHNYNNVKKLQLSNNPDGTIIITLNQIFENISVDLIKEPALCKALFSDEEEHEIWDIICQMRTVFIFFHYYKSEDRQAIFDTEIGYCIKSDFGKKIEDKNYGKITKIIQILTNTLFQEKLMPDEKYLSLLYGYKVNFYNALYSSVKSIDDMLYVHLLRDRYNCVRLGNKLKKFPVPEESELLHFEDKKMYSDIMRNCDYSIEISATEQYAIKKTIEQINKSNINEVVTNIVSVCKKYGYTRSYLLKNINYI